MTTTYSDRFRCACIFALFLSVTNLSLALAAQQDPRTKPPAAAKQTAVPGPQDYSKEAYVVDKYDTVFRYNSDGTWDGTTTVVVRVQSQAGIQTFGNVMLPYEAGNDQAEIAYVHVRKPDGTTVASPMTNIQDVPAGVTLQAPMYSDVHVKQLPVTGLNPGDTLEYQLHLKRTRAEIPNQFWLSTNFFTQGIVLEENFEVQVPAKKYVKVVSADVQPTMHQDGDTLIYDWKTSHLKDTSEADSKKAIEPAKPSIQLTTFRSWQQLGEWYRGLQADRVLVTPAIRNQEQQITKGLATDDARQRAIYSYVSTQFRYIGLSFGVGRLQPHMADAVLQNKFGDCKDKHTVFAALMQAAGYPVWPALIGSATKLDPDVPSPAQFDHVISVLPQKKNLVWLDTTEEVAPFGMLMSPLRDKLALVIPSTGAPELKRTPLNPPFPMADSFSMKASMDDKAVLTGHADMTTRGDMEILLRAAFHATPREDWNKLGQNVSNMFGFSGTVSNFSADDPDDTSRPFHIGYDYARTDYGGSDGKQIIPPLPPVPFLLGETSKQPYDTIPLGATGERDYRATVLLPKGDVATLPADKTINTDFAEYSETASIKDGTLIAERFFKVKISKLPAARWEEYLKFEKSVQARESLMTTVAKTVANVPATGVTDNPKSYELLKQAYQAIDKRKFNDAETALQQVQALNPTQWDLWRMYAMLDDSQNKPQEAIDSLYKEVANHPDNTEANLTLGSQLMDQKQYAEAVIFIRKAADSSDGTPDARILLGQAEIKEGQKEAGIADFEAVMRSAQKPMLINNVAYELALQDADLVEAQQYTQKALNRMEAASGKITLAALTNDDLASVSNIGDTWDTAGWLDFQQGRYAEAEKYVQAAWTLNQRGVVADHLGHIYEKEGRGKQAAQMYRLALAAGGLEDSAETTQRLNAVAAAIPGNAKANSHEELSNLRTFPITGLPRNFASAQFFVLIGQQGVDDVQFIQGADSLRDAIGSLKKINYATAFPDEGPEKIARRGILSCSADTGSCEFVLLLPQTARAK